MNGESWLKMGKIEFQHSKVFLASAERSGKSGVEDMFQIIILIPVPVVVPMYQANSKFRCHFLHIKTRLDQGEIIWHRTLVTQQKQGQI